MFNGSFCANDSGRRKYDRIRRRMDDIVDDAFDKITASARSAGIDHRMTTKSIDNAKLGQSGCFTGSGWIFVDGVRHFTETKLTYVFAEGAPVWSMYIGFGNAKWRTKGMNTKIFLVYLSGNLSGAFKQMLGKI